MMNTDPRIDAYIAKSADFAKPILTHLRELIHTACPDVEETWKWSFPHFLYKGEILCSMAAFKQHCVFGFWKAALIEDVDNILEVAERAAMGHLGRIQTIKDLPKDGVLKKYIKAAMKLNDAGIKLPARKKPTEKQKQELEIPEDFVKALKKDKTAQTLFDDFSYSHKKEYIQWFDEAKNRTNP